MVNNRRTKWPETVRLNTDAGPTYFASFALPRRGESRRAPAYLMVTVDIMADAVATAADVVLLEGWGSRTR
jgi:hypothetical protein